ncbi:DUF2383 domain-containing protein [Anaeromicrobium sediminis]|uniref:DUF2383 domain-containing protein n=1 Tax=Anaeromicrobium sediminis TaxID=1478221 RepID=A0A267MHJ9_9FIRM|nr:DUF2383 domain-containing protein [Anaeromicrobium sediminis]PAB59051.1 hypothetical protein CCE28_12780 [Anaeromicrobium sediminis]
MNKNVKTLNKVLEGEHMAVESFNVLIDEVQDKMVKSTFQNIQQKHRQNISDLARHIQDMGEMPDETLGLKGVYGDMKLKMEVRNKSDKEAVKAAIDGIYMGVDFVRNNLKENVDVKTKSILNHVLKDYEESADTLNKLM